MIHVRELEELGRIAVQYDGVKRSKEAVKDAESFKIAFDSGDHCIFVPIEDPFLRKQIEAYVPKQIDARMAELRAEAAQVGLALEDN